MCVGNLCWCDCTCMILLLIQTSRCIYLQFSLKIGHSHSHIYKPSHGNIHKAGQRAFPTPAETPENEITKHLKLKVTLYLLTLSAHALEGTLSVWSVCLSVADFEYGRLLALQRDMN